MSRPGTLLHRYPILWRLGALALLAELGYAIVVPTLPLYLAGSLRAPVRLIGVVIGAFAVVETLCKAPFGALGDRIGRRPLIVGGLAVSALTPALMAAIRFPLLFVPLRALDGSGSAALWPAVMATVADEVEADDRATALSVFNMTYMVGLGLGPPVGLWISHAAGTHRAAFYTASGLLALAALLGLALLPRAAPHPASGAPGDEGHPLSLAASLRAMREAARATPALGLMFLLGFIQQLAFTLLTPILVLYAHQVAGLSDAEIGHLFLAPALAVGALAVPLGRLADRMPRARAIQIGFACSVIGLALVPFLRSLPALAATAVALGVAYAFAEPAWLALVTDLAPAEGRGAALGGVGAAQGLGFMVGPVVGGHLWEAVSPSAPFYLCAALLGACFLLVRLNAARLTPSS